MYKIIQILIMCCTVSSVGAKSALIKHPESVNWPAIKASLFKGDPKILQDNYITLSTPKRAENAAVMPVKITLDTAAGKLEKLYLIVDNNPSPIAGVFTVPDFNALIGLQTRIRVNEYGDVRVVAQTSDGVLHMTHNFVKASGGCSAPAGADSSDDAISKLGKMKLQHKKTEGAMSTRLMINHPNNSGLQINQVSREWIPANYVQAFTLNIDGKPLLSFEGGISISENPSMQFYFKDMMQGVIKAVVKDSSGRVFDQEWNVAN